MSIKRYRGQTDYFGFTATDVDVQDSSVAVSMNEIQDFSEDGALTNLSTVVAGVTLTSNYTVRCGAKTAFQLPALLSKLTINAGDLPVAVSTSWVYFVTGMTIETSAGAMPTFGATATGIKADCAPTAYAAFDTIPLSPFAKAQALFNIGTATDGILAAASYSFGGSIQTKTNGAGANVVIDLTGAAITANITLNQSADDVQPTFALGEGWILQTPLVNAGSVSGVTTWTLTAVLPLTRARGV